jgi:hypothetical protein
LPASHAGTIYAQRGEEMYKPRVARPNITVRFICEQCNNGWMSQIEGRVKPIIQVLLSKKSTVINSEQQSNLSTWSVKNAMVFEPLRRKYPGFYKSEERSSLKQNLSPPSQTYVWIALCTEFNGFYSSAHDLVGHASGVTESVIGYVTTMSFGPLALQVLSLRLPETHPKDISTEIESKPGPWEKVTIPIWLIKLSQQPWHPSIGLVSEIGLETLSQRWVSNNT